MSARNTATVVVRLEETQTTEETSRVLIDLLRRAKAAGVRLLLWYTTAEPEESFALSDEDGDDIDGKGFGDDTDPDVGGVFASVRE